MISRYEKYKYSGIAWASKIPYDWNVHKGKTVLNLMQRTVRKDDDVVTCFRDGEVVLRSLRRTDGFTMSDKEIGYQGINIGDIVIHGMDGFAGAMGVSKSQGKGTPVYVVCTPKNGNNERYIVYYLRSLAHNDVFLALSTGIRERSCDLKWNKIAVLPFLVPNHQEQVAIADFLDKKCGEIDDLIGLQEQIIEELVRYKQSVITEAVTRGLNPDAPLKDSGIEWIGEIPEHWDKDKIIRSFSLIGSGTTPKATNDDNYEGSINWLQSGDIKGEYIKESKNKISNEAYKLYSVLKIYKSPFIVIAMYGASVGNLAVSDIDACVNQACCVLGESKHLFKFLFYAIKASQQFLIYKAEGGGQPNISQDKLKNLWLAIPPLTEQQAIADYLDRKCKEIDELTEIKKQKIEQLKEYKKSVIYEFVTGKKRVI